MACDAGLEPLARLFSEQNPKGPAPEDAAKAFLNDDVPTIEDAIQGAANILAERFSERADYRQKLRRSLWQEARLTCSLQVEEKDAGPMLTYADFSERITRLPSYRVLAINRGENEKEIKGQPQGTVRQTYRHAVPSGHQRPFALRRHHPKCRG